MTVSAMTSRPRRQQSLGIVALGVCVWCVLTTSAAAQVSRGRFQFAQAQYTTSEDFGVAVVTVQRHLGSDGRAAVYVSTRQSGGGNAIVGRDFRAIFNYSLIWQDGDDLDQQLYVRVLNDTTPQESNKSFTLFLHDANGADLNPERNQTQVVLVPPSNLASGSFRLLSPAVTTSESSRSTLEIPVLWEGGTTSSARVAYSVLCETACDTTNDYTAVGPTTLVWTRGGNATQLIRVNITDDGVFEQSETFRVALLPPSDLDAVAPDPTKDPSSVFALPPATLGNVTEVRVTIQGPNNVNAGVVQFEAPCFPACPGAQYSVRDGGIIRVYVQRRNGSDGSVVARVVSVDGSARGGIDFKTVDTTVRWQGGDAATKMVLVETIAGVVRSADVAFQLRLTDVQGSSGDVAVAAATSDVAGSTTITIQGPTNVVVDDVNFVLANPLATVLRPPDESFLPLVTRFDSGLHVCPRIVVRKPGELTLSLRRSFGTIDRTPASVVVKTVDDTAIGDLDYVALPAAGQRITWAATDSRRTTKTLTITIPRPLAYYAERRSFVVAIASVDGAALGLCHFVEVLLDGVSRPPHVTGFDLNMNTGAMTLRLSDVVLAATFTALAFTLQSEKDSGSSTAVESFQLTTQSTTASADGATIVATLGANDLNALKRFAKLAKSSRATFLSVREGALDYVLENCLARGFSACRHAPFEAIPSASAMAVAAFTPDTTRPVLLSFTMDLGLQLVKLHFSEPVNGDTVRIESVGFSDTANAVDLRFLSSRSSRVFRPSPNALSGVLLYDGNPLPQDAAYLTIQLGADDLAALRSVGSGLLGLQPASTFATVASNFVRDFASPPNDVVPVDPPTLALPALRLMRVAAVDCSPCPTGTFQASSCSDMQSRVCQPCTVCPTNSYALTACSPVQDMVCYPCTECSGGRFTKAACTPTSDRVCASCTVCSADEYEASPCANQADRVCRTCDSCTLTKDQQRLCSGSKRWRRRQMKSPYGCPTADQTFQTLEARLQRAKSNRCGAGRCSCTGNGVGNANPNGESFPNDPRCTGPDVYNIDL